MCIGLRATFTEEFLDYFLSTPLRRINLRLVRLYFRRVRACRVILDPDAVELAASRADVCDCRIIDKKCDHRLDLCFKLEDRSKAPKCPDAVGRSDLAYRNGLVRMRVETLGRKVEYCHCCTCCCQALRVARRLGPGYVMTSRIFPETSDACAGCGECVSVCPIGVRSAGETLLDRCLGCGLCAPACPQGAIRFNRNGGGHPWKRSSSPERMLRRNRALAHMLGGSMTIYVLATHWFFRRSRRREAMRPFPKPAP